jgi:hypothetical protein
MLNIGTLRTDTILTVIPPKALTLRPIYSQSFPSPLQRPLSHVFSIRIPSEDVSEYDMREARPSVLIVLRVGRVSVATRRLVRVQLYRGS